MRLHCAIAHRTLPCFQLLSPPARDDSLSCSHLPHRLHYPPILNRTGENNAAARLRRRGTVPAGSDATNKRKRLVEITRRVEEWLETESPTSLPPELRSVVRLALGYSEAMFANPQVCDTVTRYNPHIYHLHLLCHSCARVQGREHAAAISIAPVASPRSYVCAQIRAAVDEL